MSVDASAQQGSREWGRAFAAGTVCEAFQVTAAERPDRVAIRTKGDEVSLTWAEYARLVRRGAAGLHALGLRRGDTIAFMLTNRPEFHWLDAAAMHVGAIAFSIYNTSSPEQIDYLLTDAANRIVITERAFLDRVLEVARGSRRVEQVVCVDGGGEPGTLTLAELEAPAGAGFDFEAAWRAVTPDDVVTLIYTSGTTGPPKGVELTHRSWMAEMRAARSVMGDQTGGSIISFLPAAHLADRGLTHYGAMCWGWTIADCPDPREVIAYLPEARPTVFGSVPRIWEKLKAGLEAAMAAERDEEKRRAARWALDVGLRKVALEQAGRQVPAELAAEHAHADGLVFSKLRAMLGLDQVELFVVGAAPTPYEVLEFFAAIGIPICEAWGMSEISGFGTMNPPDAIRLGTVGPPLPGVEIRLADDGEVLVGGEIVMRGYRNMPEKTRETLTADGWLLTGDVGEFDEAGYLKIVDRKKELIINAAGKNMSPANIEAKLKSAHPLIGQAICIGDRRPYNVALVTLDPDMVPVFARELGIEDPSPERLAREPAVISAVQEGVERANSQLSRVEQIKKFTVLPAEWLPGGDELTPTMKLRRKPIQEKYARDIDALYA
jgi:long-chain acyl-CoA synthetase